MIPPRRSLLVVLAFSVILAACGGSGTGLADKTATARTADANDAATVTAFAGGGRTPSAGTPSTSANQGTGTKAAGGKGGFAFATFPSGGSGGPAPTTRSAAGGTPAAGTPRGTVASAGSARTGTPAGLNGNSYTDPQGRFTLMVPQGWRVQQPGSTDIDFQAAPATASALRGAFQIAAEDVGTGITLDDYATGTMDSIKQTVTNYRDVQGGIQQMSSELGVNSSVFPEASVPDRNPASLPCAAPVLRTCKRQHHRQPWTARFSTSYWLEK